MHQRAEVQKAGNILLVVFACLGIYMANSAFKEFYQALLEKHLFDLSVRDLVCEGFMSLFFLQVVMELKREYRFGILKGSGNAILPMIAALGGMLVPAAIFLLINFHFPAYYKAFAIPCATDIAFASFAFNLAGNRKMFEPARLLLLAIAIFDDLGAIILIALFYNTKLCLHYLLLTISGLFLINIAKKFFCNWRFFFVCTLGAGLTWTGLKLSGIQPTLAGVLVGALLPLKEERNVMETFSNALGVTVQLLIMPTFAFVACNIDFLNFGFSSSSTLFWGVALGLFLGKQVGICSFAWFAIKARLAVLPKTLLWSHLYLVSAFAGIGFTMSLFISELSFVDKCSSTLVKTGLVSGSVASCLWGLLLTLLSVRRNARNQLSKSSN